VQISVVVAIIMVRFYKTDVDKGLPVKAIYCYLVDPKRGLNWYKLGCLLITIKPPSTAKGKVVKIPLLRKCLQGALGFTAWVSPLYIGDKNNCHNPHLKTIA